MNIDTISRWTIGIALAAVLVVYSTGVACVLWTWFMVPFGLPQIGFAWALGLGALVSVFMETTPPATEEVALRHLGFVVLKPSLLLVTGYIAKQFM